MSSRHGEDADDSGSFWEITNLKLLLEKHSHQNLSRMNVITQKLAKKSLSQLNKDDRK
jgi:hypothetical protein